MPICTPKWRAITSEMVNFKNVTFFKKENYTVNTIKICIDQNHRQYRKELKSIFT